MPDQDPSAAGAQDERDPAQEPEHASGGEGTGSPASDHADTGADQPEREQSTTESEYDRLKRRDAEMLMEGDEPESESQDEPAAEDKPAGDEPAAPESEAPGDPKAEETKPAEPKDEPDPDALTPEDRKRLRKKDAERIDRLLKNRADARKELESAKPKAEFAERFIEHAKAAGLVNEKDGKLDFSALHQRIELERALAGLDAKGRAAEFRKLADSLDPPQEPEKPIALPDDLTVAVEAGIVSRDVAQAEARKRTGDQQPAQPKRQQPPPPPQTDAARVPTAAWTPADEARGQADIQTVDAEYRARFKQEWDAISGEANKLMAEKVKYLLETTGFRPRPEAWGKIAKEAAEAAIAKRKPAIKTPPKSLGASRTAPPSNRGYETREETAQKLMRGVLT